MGVGVLACGAEKENWKVKLVLIKKKKKLIQDMAP